MNELNHYISGHKLKLIHDREQLPEQHSQVTIPLGYKTPDNAVRPRQQGHMTWPRSSGWGLPIGEHEETKKKLAEERRLDYMRHLEEQNKKKKQNSKENSVSLEKGSVHTQSLPKEDTVQKDSKLVTKYMRPDATDLPKNEKHNNEVDYSSPELSSQREWAQARLDYEALLSRKRADESRYRLLDEDINLGHSLRNYLSDGHLVAEGYERFKRFENEARKLKAQQHVFADEEDWLIRYIEARNRSDAERQKLLHWLKKELETSSHPSSSRINSADGGRRTRHPDSGHKSSPPMPPAPPPPGEPVRFAETLNHTAKVHEGGTLLVGRILSPNTIRKRREEYRKELEKQIEEQLERRKRGKKLEELEERNRTRTPTKSPDRYSYPENRSVLTNNSHEKAFYLHPKPDAGTSLNNYHTYPGRSAAMLDIQGENHYSASYELPTVNPENHHSRNFSNTLSKSSTFSTGTTTVPLPQGSVTKASSVSNDLCDKKARNKAYHDELEKQMKDNKIQKLKKKEELERYEKQMDEANKDYNPWGKGGSGAPMRDPHGNLLTERKRMCRITSDITCGQQFASPSSLPQDLLSGQFYLNSPSEVLNNFPAAMIASSPNVFADHPQSQTEGISQLRRTKSIEDGFSNPSPKVESRNFHDQYKEELRKQIEDKKRRAEQERERQRLEEEEELMRIEKERKVIQEEYEAEQKRIRAKEEEKQRKNEELRKLQEDKRKEADRKQKEEESLRLKQLMEEQEKERLDKQNQIESRSSSPPVPALMHLSQTETTPASSVQKTKLADKQNPTPPVLTPRHSGSNTPTATPEHKPSTVKHLQTSPVSEDILTQLAAMRKQLRLEHERIRKNSDLMLHAENNFGEMDNLTSYQNHLPAYSLPRYNKDSENVDIINFVRSKKGVSVRRRNDSGNTYFSPSQVPMDTRMKEISGSEASLQGCSVLIREAHHIPPDESDVEAKSLLAETTFIPIDNLEAFPDDLEDLSSQKDTQNENLPPSATLKRNHSARERRRKQQHSVSASSPT